MSSSCNKPNHKTLQIKVIHINSQGEARQGSHHHIFGSLNSVGEAKVDAACRIRQRIKMQERVSALTGRSKPSITFINRGTLSRECSTWPFYKHLQQSSGGHSDEKEIQIELEKGKTLATTSIHAEHIYARFGKWYMWLQIVSVVDEAGFELHLQQN